MLVAEACSSSAARAANGENISLSWSAPPDVACPDSAHVLDEIRRYVGAAPTRAPIEAEATVHSISPERWELVLKTQEGATTGERTLEGESCQAVADAAVVVLAWMIDPGAMAQHLLPAPPDPTPRPPPPTPPPRKPPPGRATPSATTGTRRRTRAFLDASTVGDLGTLPSAALGVEAGGGVVFGPWRIGGYAAYWPSRSKTSAALSDGRAAGATFTLRLLGLEACVQPWSRGNRSRFAFSWCAGPELDQILGTGFGVNAPTTASTTWLSLITALNGRLSLGGSAGFVLGVAAVVPTERQHFALRGVGEVYRPTALAGRVSGGFELEL